MRFFCSGFAKWFEYLATDHIVPEYNVFSEFFSTQFIRYFDYCINILHNEADEIDEKDFSFEGFIYSKGSCLMRMLHLYLGHEQFLQAVQLFLTRYAYKTATAMDFWMCVQEITQMPISNSKKTMILFLIFFFVRSFVEELIHSWCTKKSYPVVQVKMLEYDEMNQNSKLELTQMSFCHGHDRTDSSLKKSISCHCIKTDELLNENENERRQISKSTTNIDENWIIPITILNNQSEVITKKFLMKNKHEILEINRNLPIKNDEQIEPKTKKSRIKSNWFKLNICSGGPYRVLYSSELLDELIQAIHNQELNVFDRFNLENDMYALAMGSFTSLVDYLRLLLNAYMNEIDDELIWKDIESNLIRIGTLFEYDKQLYDYYRRFILYFHRNLFQCIGLCAQPNESVARGRLRCFLLVILGTIGYDPSIISYAREQIDIYLSDTSITVLWPICAIVAHHATEGDLTNLFQLWEKRSRRDDRLRCAYGLSYVQNPVYIERVLDLFSLTNNSPTSQQQTIRLNERIECYKGFCLTKQGREFYQRYIEINWLNLRRIYTDEYLETLVRETFGYFSTNDEAERLENFFHSYETFAQKTTILSKDSPSTTPCTRLTVHLCLDDQELSTINKNTLPSPILHHRSIVPDKVKEVASIIAHTTRTRATLLERDRERLMEFFQSQTFPLPTTTNSSSQIRSVNINHVSNLISTCSSTNENKRKRRLSNLNTNNSSPPVRNLLASDTSV